MLNQKQTPLLDALKVNAERFHAAFYTPGHKQGRGISPQLAEIFGRDIFRHDLPELAELDNLFAPCGVIQAAQELAAALFGASHSWFLANGSTCGIEAAILATCGDGDKILLPRNVHSSAIAGLILSGAMPIFLNPEYDTTLDIAHSITPQTVATALEKHPDAKAVMMVYPTYYGVCGDVQAIANIAHEYHIPLLVDEAHGAHFAFHPELPLSALAAGADLTVQSIHKTLGAFTQASMLHLQGNRINRDRLRQALQLVQSTSPSYLLLASLDAARQQMAISGKELLTHTLELAHLARTHISLPSFFPLTPGSCLDSTRLTINVSSLGMTGFVAEEILDEKYAVTPEFASLKHLTFIISIGNTQEDIQRLIDSLSRLTQEYGSEKFTSQQPILWENLFKVDDYVQISPRSAFFAPHQILPIRETIGHICAETICPYPPGIPVLMPGEVITLETIEYLQTVKNCGGFVTGCTDGTLANIKVVKVYQRVPL
ncbi:aminotransferase class I/II-fold pyridoxal phosphate-dependent enzyme [Calothrix sp. 336/3]|uniref:aminotransferase class I/II-fold pyridoxal phosphate-dependent enzyme n=1 Tax=Calothrix sp. 336/3 TaxID=1337936 RepID=UPI0004E2B4C4|nr:aminotransferase class I/II-fold pyridoxal phosphate-dependent enzyme [Calothrix sp. 336/3]AKG23444.1 arginine decarboxylase [Calothrix sp. 336/3]